MEYAVIIKWDSEAEVWTASSDDVKGLILEDDSIDILMEQVRKAIPELLLLNNQISDTSSVIRFYAEKSERMYA